jgi:formylmethanofuran dehydrogenase subunit E
VVEIPPEDRPGRPISRVFCIACGEGVNDRREVYVDGQPLCRACAEGAYYRVLNGRIRTVSTDVSLEHSVHPATPQPV